jgi:phosphatidylglycerophosphatase A
MNSNKNTHKSFLDYISIAITTFGVGFIPFAPGTWGSAVGVGIYLLVRQFELNTIPAILLQGFSDAKVEAWQTEINIILFVAFNLLGIWAAGRATVIFNDKDPQKAIIDEILGQLLTFMFVPFAISWQLILAGFLLFRLFDIWKPYPIDALQGLPAGIGVCADDILAGVYAGTCLAFIYAVTL